MMLRRRIEMRAGRRRIRRRAIAFVVNVKTVFSRREILNISGDLNFIANFGERHRAGDLAAGFSFELRHCFTDFLRLRETNQRAKHRDRENYFHAANVRRFF